MRTLIRRCPPLTSLKLGSNRFGTLVHSILSQQISVHAARAIRTRLTELVGPTGMTAERVAGLDSDKLREIGVSRVKVSYMKDLAEKVSSGEVQLNQIGRLNDDSIIRELTCVKGVGVWTAQMFLIFSLGRLDVFPLDDYGVRAAIRTLYSLDDLPDKATSQQIAEPWRPYATIATWYLWRSHESDGKTGGGV
jgi:DNA-3-methyladenine glycosylase II